MKRRDFVATSLTAAAALKLAQSPAQAQTESEMKNENQDVDQEWYELRIYALKPESDAKALHDFLRDAAIPAWNRLGSQPIGVFSPRDAGDKPQLYLLIPHASLSSVMETASFLAADAEYLKAGAPYLDLPATDPAYVRYESSLMRAFAGMPRVVLPPYSPATKSRIFELRTYESHNEVAAQKKIEMFNGGEIEIMQRVGLAPVFYGEMLFGNRLPNLTYLLSAENQEAHGQHWGAFGKDAEWKKISAIPEYADAKIISKITKTFLVPTDYSQI